MEMSVKLISSLMRLFIRGCLREQEELASEQDIPDRQAHDGNEREEDSYYPLSCDFYGVGVERLLGVTGVNGLAPEPRTSTGGMNIAASGKKMRV